MRWRDINLIGFEEVLGSPKITVWWFDAYRIEHETRLDGLALNQWLKKRGGEPINWVTVDVHDESFFKLIAGFLNSIHDSMAFTNH